MADTDDPKPVKGVSITKVKAVTAGDTIRTPKGNIVTKQEWLKAKDNGLPFPTHQDYANYVDGWASPVSKTTDNSSAAAPSIQPSDKARGMSNTYYPSNANRQTPTPAEIKSNRY